MNPFLRTIARSLNAALHRRTMIIVRLAGFALVCGFAAGPVQAQTCPAETTRGHPLGEDGIFPGKSGKIDCDHSNGSCSLYCYYPQGNGPLDPRSYYEARVTVVWWPRNTPSTSGKDYACRSLGPDESKGAINSPRKQAFAIWDGTSDILDSYLRSAAEQLLREVEDQAVPCDSGGRSAGPRAREGTRENAATACLSYSKDLAALQGRATETNDELHSLEQRDASVELARDVYSEWSKIVAALNTPNYKGRLTDELKKLKSSPYKREMAHEAGLQYRDEWDTDNLAFARAFRDRHAAVIEYFKSTTKRIPVLHNQQVENEVEMAALRLKMKTADCGGTFEPDSCNLTGWWVIETLQIVSGKARTYETFWEFTPSTPHRYAVVEDISAAKGEAEIYGHDVVVRWTRGAIEGRYTFNLDDRCDIGNGRERSLGGGTVAPDEPIRVSRQSSVGGVPPSERIEGNRGIDTSVASIEGARYTVRYQGRIYQTNYKQERDNNGMPMDLYYYQIILPDGTQATQNGQELWGRFVRVPAASQRDQSQVVWWHATWVQRGGVWEQVSTEGAQFEVLGEIK